MASPAASLVLLSLVCASLGASDHLRNGLFRSRVGEIVITHATPVKGDALLVAIDSMHEDLASSRAKGDIPSEMKENEVASLASHAIGALPVSATIPAQTSAFSSSVLRKPRANLLMMIPDIGQVTAEEMDLSNIQALRQAHPSFTVDSTFEPRSTLAQLTTLVTGELPSVHGIVGRQWMDRSGKSAVVSNAFEALGSHSAVPTLGDVMIGTFSNPLVVSLSGCSKLAAATAPHPNTAGNVHVFSVNGESKTMDDTAAQSALSSGLTIDDITQFLADDSSRSLLHGLRRSGASLTVENSQLTVEAGNSKAVFDLTQDSDYKMFAELVAVQRLISNLRDGAMAKLAADSNPDLFTLTLTGFQNMRREYGANDSRTVMAARVLDAVLPQVVQLFSQVYHSELATEVMLMGSAPVVSEGRVKKAIAQAAGSDLHSSIDMEASYPSLYVEETMSKADIDNLCARVATAANAHGVRAECISELSRPILLQNKAAAKADEEADETYSRGKIANYQINLWVTILLIVVLLAGLYPLMYDNFSEGTFSSFLFAKKYI